MAKNFNNQLTGQIGEALVVAELGRRDIIATSFSGNVPDIDILAYKDGKSIPIQVKTWRNDTGTISAIRYIKISKKYENDDRSTNPIGQSVDGLQKLDRDLIYVFVRLRCEKNPCDSFFILTQGDLQDIIKKHYEDYLNKDGRVGQRPENNDSLHCALKIEELNKPEYKDNWDLILKRLSYSDKCVCMRRKWYFLRKCKHCNLSGRAANI